MIVKKVPARPAGRDATVERAVHARRLVDYVRLPEKDSAEKEFLVAYMLSAKLGDSIGERLFHIGGRNFVSTTLVGQRAEMVAVADEARRSPNPLDHWLLSWREGELPTPEQVDETVALFLDHLGVAEQPCIYACHGDTHNRHVHIALNRYDAVAGRMIEINDGFTWEAAHQAVALIVDRFGWEPERDARYEVANGRPVLTASARARFEEGRIPIRPGAASYENRTGYRSAQRIAQDEAVPIIETAASWPELHSNLAAIGIAYELKGTNGAVLAVGEERVGASSVSRAITRTRLERRLGTFEPRGLALVVVSRDDGRDRFLEAFRADEYREQVKRWREWTIAQRRGRELGRAGGRPTAAVERARDLARQRMEKPEKPPPNLESWYYARAEGAFAARWRHRLRAKDLPALLGATRSRAGVPRAVDGYSPYPCSDGIRYALSPDGPTAFLDRGSRIDVVAKDDAALLAALRLAAIRFDGKIAIKGSVEFRERVFALAEEHGLGHMLTDTDLIARRAPWRVPAPIRPVILAREPSSRTRAREGAETNNGNRSTAAAGSRTAVHESTRDHASSRRSRGRMAGLRSLPAFSVDDRSGSADRLLLRVPGDHIRGGPPNHSVRGAGPTPSLSTTPVEQVEDPHYAARRSPTPRAEPSDVRRRSLAEQARELGAASKTVTPKGPSTPAAPDSSRRGGPER